MAKVFYLVPQVSLTTGRIYVSVLEEELNGRRYASLESADFRGTGRYFKVELPDEACRLTLPGPVCETVEAKEVR